MKIMSVRVKRTLCVSDDFTSSLLSLCVNQPGLSESMFLERHEEDVLFRHYERRMLDFCNAFKPAMPKSVVVCMFCPVICVTARAATSH